MPKRKKPASACKPSSAPTAAPPSKKAAAAPASAVRPPTAPPPPTYASSTSSFPQPRRCSSLPPQAAAAAASHPSPRRPTPYSPYTGKMGPPSPFPKLPPPPHMTNSLVGQQQHSNFAPIPSNSASGIPMSHQHPSSYSNNSASYHLCNNVYRHHTEDSTSRFSLPRPYSEHSNFSTGGGGVEPIRATNAIDEVINEVNHLLQSASEAQGLGRLRNSYSALLLAHQRLVGVGRRVDRSYCEAEESSIAKETLPPSTPSRTKGSSSATTKTKSEKGAEGEEEEVGEHSQLSTATTTTYYEPTFLPPLVSQPPLPPTLTTNYSDVAYVEHLARSAMELHHKRTGRGMQHDMAIERAAHAAKMKKMEEDQIRAAARNVFALGSSLSGSAAAGSAGGGEGEDGNTATPQKRKGGRGKKPPTLVMHTMAGRNLDVRELMRGVL